MSASVLLFPGQGSQEPGMADAVATRRPDLAERVAASVGEDPFPRVADGTRFAQPAIFCASLAGLERLGRPEADLYAGHSLGEISALVAAGALTEDDGLQIVAERGGLMDRAAVQSPGGMVVVRAEREEAEALAGRHDLVVANDNAPKQIVLSGPLAGIEAAEAEAGETGVRAKRLPVAGAFHSPLLAHVVEPFRAALGEIEVRPPRAPVYSCVTAAPFPDDPRDCLARALVSTVRWVDVLHALHAAGGRPCARPESRASASRCPIRSWATARSPSAWASRRAGSSRARASTSAATPSPARRSRRSRPAPVAPRWRTPGSSRRRSISCSSRRSPRAG